MIDLNFPHTWRAEILSARPLILPPRHFTYPAQAEEVERGALELLVHPQVGQTFLATCALGFRDPAVPSGVWSTPDPAFVCAIAGGYAYLIDTAAPDRFTMLAHRPVLEVRVALDEKLLLFVGNRTIIAWGPTGQAWESEVLSDEGLAIASIQNGMLHGKGWRMLTDKEEPFALDLLTGVRSG